MKKSDIYEVAIKILGLYVFTTCIGLLREIFMLYGVYSQQSSSPDEFDGVNYAQFFMTAVGFFAIVVLFASLLTFKTKTIVRFICKPEDYEESAKLFADKKTVYEIALVLMGLLLITWTLPDFAVKLKYHFQSVQINQKIKDNDAKFLMIEGAKIVLGLFAIIGATPIASFLSKDNDK